jgi:hypothetical protein
MSVSMAILVLAAGLLPLAVLRRRTSAALERPDSRAALIALGRVHRAPGPRPLMASAPEPPLDADVVLLDDWRRVRSRAEHPAGRGRVRRSRGA